MALNPPSGIVKWYSHNLVGPRTFASLKWMLTGKKQTGGSPQTSYVKLSDKEADEVIENIKKDSEGFPGFDEENAPDKGEEYQKWIVARYLTKVRVEGFEERRKEGLKELEEELGPEGLDELLNLIREESKVASGGGGSSSPPEPPSSPPEPPEPPSSSALAVVPKKPEDLVEEEIDSQILSILGLEDVFDLTYEEYASLLKEKAVEGRMADSQMSTESIELVTNELKRVKGKTGSFKVKPKKVDINKVLNRKTPTPSGAIVKPQKLLPATLEPETQEDTGEEKEDLKEDVTNGIGDILRSLVSIRSLLQDQNEAEEESTKEDRKKTEKEKKKEREKTLEKKKSKKSPILKALTKPVDDFFGAIKKFFTNVILGSVVLGIFKWLKDPKNKKAIDDFTNFLENNSGLILGGLLAIASVPLVSTILGFLAPITAIAIPAITSAFAFLASPAGLAALALIGGVGAGLAAVKGVEVVGKKLLYGGGDLVRANEILDKKLADAGITKQGKDFSKGNPQQRRKRVPSGKPLTQEQKKIFEEVQAERSRLNDIRKRMDAEIKTEVDKVKPSGTKPGRGGSVQKYFTAEDREKREKIKQQVIQKYNQEINLATPAAQPQTPAVPGTTPKGETSDPESGGGSGVNVVQASHPDTGSGWTIPGAKDAHGRPPIFSKGGAEAFARMMKDSKGVVKPSDIASSQRSPAKNADVGGVPGSKHLKGNAMDIHGASQTWIRNHGKKYGWHINDYPGSHGGHFDFKGGGGSVVAPTQPAPTPSAQVAPTSPPTPSIPSPTGRGNIVPIPIPTGGGAQQSTSGSGGNQTPVPRFSSEDPNNMGTMVIRSIYNIIG